MEQAEETLAALKVERTAIVQQQTTLTAQDDALFYQLQRCMDELTVEMHLGEMAIVEAKLDLLWVSPISDFVGEVIRKQRGQQMAKLV